MELEQKTLVEYFREGIQRACERQGISLQESTEFYVVNLLSEFLDIEKLFGDENGELVDDALATIFGRALEATDSIERFRLMKIVGDRSLYLAGFFPDSLRRKIIDVDYYMNLGGVAYSSVSAIADRDRARPMSGVFTELSDKFEPLVELISEVSEEAGCTSNEDLLRLYERWLHTGSERLSGRLTELGILPVSSKKGPLH